MLPFPFFPYAIVPGWNNAALVVPVANIVGVSPNSAPVPRGTVAEGTLDNHEHHQGRRPVVWRWGFLPYIKLDSFVIFALGSWYDEDANVTILTRDTEPIEFTYWNAVVHQLVFDQDFKLPTTTKATEIGIRFDVILKLPEP